MTLGRHLSEMSHSCVACRSDVCLMSTLCPPNVCLVLPWAVSVASLVAQQRYVWLFSSRVNVSSKESISADLQPPKGSQQRRFSANGRRSHLFVRFDDAKIQPQDWDPQFLLTARIRRSRRPVSRGYSRVGLVCTYAILGTRETLVF